MLLAVSLWLIVLITVGVIILTYFKKRCLYHPCHDCLLTASEMIDRLKDQGESPQFVELELDDGYGNGHGHGHGHLIHGWYFIQNAKYPTVVISHGNGGNLTYRADLIQMLYRMKTNVCIYDYQGYGRSTGSPTEKRLYKAGETVMHHLIYTLNVPLEQIIQCGESLGSGVASYLLVDTYCSKLLILSGFSSVKEMFYHLLPEHLSFLTGLSLLFNEFPTFSYLSHYQGKTLILHSRTDGLIPYSQAVKNKCNDRCQLLEIKGTHNQPLFDRAILEQMKDFLAEGTVALSTDLNPSSQK